MMNQQIYIPSLASTNAYLQNRLQEEPLEEGTLVYTSFQTNGRGQLTNTWESQADKNLLLSLLLCPTWLPIREQFVLSQAVALGVVDFLSVYASGFRVKWPNDIYWQDKKIAGILIENNLQAAQIGSSIVGIGLNINQLEFLSDAPNPISLAQITGKQFDLASCLNDLHKAVLSRYWQAKNNPLQVRQDYLNVLYRYRTWAMFQDESGVFEGYICDVEPKGYLHLIDRNQNERRYAFKEVHFIL